MVKVRFEGYVVVNPLVEGKGGHHEVESERNLSQNAAMGNVKGAVYSYLKLKAKGAFLVTRK
jgi:hypothetical protein